MICVSISRLKEITDLSLEAVDLVELRFDQIGLGPEEVYPLLPPHWRSVATCRPGNQEERTRMEWLQRAMELGATYLDVELESDEAYLGTLLQHAKRCRTLPIVSYHNFEGTPSREVLADTLTACHRRGGTVAKVATAVHSIEDVRALLSLYDLQGRKVVIGMGERGRITRVLAPYMGSEFTFAAPRGGLETAPGQLDLRQLQEIFNVIGTS